MTAKRQGDPRPDGKRSGAAPAGRAPWWRAPLLALAVVVLGAVVVLSVRSLFVAGGPEPTVTGAGITEDATTGSTTAAGSSTGSPMIGGPFTLTDQDGRTVTDSDFHGRWMLVYFGYTYCPDVCPTSLNRNAQAIDLLGERGDGIVPVLITVDPQRDTPQLLKDYVHAFHPRMVGLTGTPQQVATVAREYRVYYAKAVQDKGEYLMDHSSLSYLVGPDGKFVQFFSHDTSPQEMADRIKALL